MVANKTPNPKKPDNNIPMEKAANGYEYDTYQYADADSNNQNNKPLSMESRNEEQGGGNDVDVYNKGSNASNNGSNGIDTDNGLSENNQASNGAVDNVETENQSDNQENTGNADEGNLNNVVTEENKENIPKSDIIIKYKDGDKLFNILDDYFENPKIFGKATPQQLHDYLYNNGFKPQALSDGRYKNKPYTEGGGYKVNWGGDKLLQYHPGGPNHHDGDEYFKLSSGKTQKLWFDMNGNPKKPPQK